MRERGVGDAPARARARRPRPRSASNSRRVLDRERRAVGGELQEVDVVFVKLAAVQRADVEHAEHGPSTSERDAEHAT